MSGNLPTSGLPTIASGSAAAQGVMNDASQHGASLIVDTTPSISEPSTKKMRCEPSSVPLSNSPLTPLTPGGSSVRIKSMSRPSTSAVAAAPHPSLFSLQYSQQPHTPSTSTLSRSSSFAASPTASQAHSPPSATGSHPSPQGASQGAAGRATPLGATHAPELVARWTSALTRAILKHWPKEQEAAATAVMGRIASRIPGIPSAAAGQARVLVTAFQDPKNGKLRDEVMGDIIDIERLVRMNEQELTNPELQREREIGFVERNKSKDWSELKKAMSGGSSDMFKCPRCGARDAMWEQRQTRSADEPMTVICSCNKCSFYWRIRG